MVLLRSKDLARLTAHQITGPSTSYSGTTHSPQATGETTLSADPSYLTKNTEHRIGSWQTQDSLPRHGSALLPSVYGSPKQAFILGTL